MASKISFLIEAASEARQQSYSPYSRFAVGAAVETSSGKVFTGTNVENISFGLTICAERASVAAAVVAGERDLQTLAIVADSAEPVVPCGACRQVLAEFNPRLKIVSQTVAGARRVQYIHKLLPSPKRGIMTNVKR